MKSCTVGEYYIQKGMFVIADVLSVHLNEDYWGSDALKFNPER